MEEWITLRFGRAARDEDELREVVRQIANAALDHAFTIEFEKHDPGRTTRGSSEVF